MTEPEKYEVLEKIGHGSFGVIHKVRRKSDGLVLCRKEISYSKMTPKEREQLQAELAILKELKHPNIVQYFERDHLKSTQDLHLYMEFCGNGDLGQVIKRLKLKNQYADEEFVWSIFAQLVTALYRCHYGEDPPDVGRNVMGLGKDAKPLKSKLSPYMILHRDLKPENVFLDTDNSVKLGDFGLSKILQSHDFASTYVGTPFYMSPEICAAERYSLYSDIWSLGCIIYELCTKEPPFNARTHIELFHKIKAGRVAPIPPVYSSELQKIITSCLQVNPNARPDTAQLLNLPAVKLMRKEQEVVRLGRKLRRDQEQAEKMAKKADEKLADLESARESIRAEVDAQLRREWEVKARLEIDRQIELETDRLRKLFESEVGKRVALEVEQRLKDVRHERARSSTPPPEQDSSIVHSTTAAASHSTVGSDSEFPSQTDISSLSLDSPFCTKQQGPLKRSTRTPFARAKTVAEYVASPMDVQMAEPSPMSIASLALSPRKDGNGRKPAEPKPNIFAAAEHRLAPINASAMNSPCTSNSPDDINHVSEDDDDDENMPINPSPTRDPFKQMQKRPSLTRQHTAPANNKRMASAPNMFCKRPTNSTNTAAANVKRPASAVPVVATSPARKGARSPTLRPKTNPAAPKLPATAENGSPQRRQPAKHSNLQSKQGNAGMLRTAMRNQLHGRTLVELAQARAGGVEREKPAAVACAKATVKAAEAEIPIWDPERDEMPSPFLHRGRGIRATLR